MEEYVLDALFKKKVAPTEAPKPRGFEYHCLGGFAAKPHFVREALTTFD
jgi:hypothetical protein